MSVLLNSVNRRLSVVMPIVAAGRGSKSQKIPFDVMEGSRLSPARLKNWAKLSREEQIEYLKAHPNSIFHRAPLRRERKGGASVPDSNSGLPHREPTEEDVAEMKQGVEELSAEGAANPGSEVREQAAALVEEQGAQLIRDNVDESVKQEIEALVNSSNSDPEPAAAPAPVDPAPAPAPAPTDSNTDPAPVDPNSGPENLVPDAVQEDDENDFEDQPSRRRRGSNSGSGIGRRLAILAGCVALAALIGGAAFVIDPTIGVLVGQKILEHFRTVHEFANDILSSVEPQSADPIDKFVAAITTWLRSGDLDAELMTQIQKRYG